MLTRPDPGVEAETGPPGVRGAKEHLAARG
jgi:hypothetical protein